MLCGGRYVHIIETMQPLYDPAMLEDFGLLFRLPEADMEPGHPFLSEQDEYADRAAAFAFCLVRLRLMRALRELRGWYFRESIFTSQVKVGIQAKHMKQLQSD